MKVWLDDIRQPPDETWVWIKDSQTLCQLVETSGADIVLISFDHDLGGDDTAYPAAALIEERAAGGQAPPKWRVHSANPVGAARLRNCLMAAEAHYERCEVKT